MHYDIIIIGTGAGGATIAHKLAQAGKKILILERGDFIAKEQDNWDSNSVFVKHKYKTQEKWYSSNNEIMNHTGYYCVGGSTKFFGGVMMRFRENDFQATSHCDGISPSWPISYHDLEPYYTEAENLYKVHGKSGVDRTEVARGRYKYNAIEHESIIEDLSNRLRARGLNPFLLPLGLSTVRDNIYQGACIKCKNFDGFPCLLDAKSDSEVVCIRPILTKSNVTLVTNAYVTRLNTADKGRRVKNVYVNLSGEQLIFSADIVIVSCGAINSAALLLKSSDEFHPNGLGNSSRVVGRYYMQHNNSVLLCLSSKINNTNFQKTLGINDYYLSSKYGYPLGHIQTLGKLNGIMLRSQSRGLIKLLPDFLYDKLAKHSIDFWLTSEDLPCYDNRISLNINKDIIFNIKPNNLKPHLQLINKFKQILQSAYPEKILLFISKQTSVLNTAHQCGTIRFGSDTKTSALDVNCKAHDLDNLYVVDSSFFVSSASVNPSLTIIANALRVGDIILSRYKI